MSIEQMKQSLRRNRVDLSVWFCVLVSLGSVVGAGLLAPMFSFIAAMGLSTVAGSLLSVGIVVLAAALIYIVVSYGIEKMWRSIDAVDKAQVNVDFRLVALNAFRAGRLGVALIPVVWLVLLATVPWAAPVLLGFAVLAPIAMMVLQVLLVQPICDGWMQLSWMPNVARRLFLRLGSRADHGLRVAAMFGNMNLAEFLIDQGAGMDTVDRSGMTALSYAVMFNHDLVASLLLEKGAHPRVAPRAIRGKPNLLRWHALMGRTQLAEALIQSCLTIGEPIDLTDALFPASRMGHVEFVEMLCENGADVNGMMGPRGIPPIVSASCSGRVDVVRLLVEKGGDVNARSGAVGMMPHMTALERLSFLANAGFANIGNRQDNAGNRGAVLNYLEQVDQTSKRYRLTIFESPKRALMPEHHRHYSLFRYEGLSRMNTDILARVQCLFLCANRISQGQSSKGLSHMPPEMWMHVLSFLIGLSQQDVRTNDEGHRFFGREKALPVRALQTVIGSVR